MKLYTSQDIADITELSTARVQQLCRENNVEKTSGHYVLQLHEWSKILPLKYRSRLENYSTIPEVIYVVRETHIYSSRMNCW